MNKIKKICNNVFNIIKKAVIYFFLNTLSIAKLRPLMFLTMLFNLGYGLANVIISTVELSLYIGMAGSYSLVFGITKYYGLKKYRRAEQLKNETEIKEIERKCSRNIAIYATAMSFLMLSFAIVNTFFYEESPNNYGLVFICFIAGAAFVKITLSTINTIRTRKNHSKIIHGLKLTDTANALTTFGLLQRSMLYYFGDENARWASGVGGIFFGLSALFVCFAMFWKYKSQKVET